MPLFSNQQGQNPAVWEPQVADGRLAKTAGASPVGVFTSDLSVSEYVLLGEAGFEPLGFVVGSSIYHVGLQVGRWNQNTELQVLTQAMYSARELAMARMRAEADHLAADGIVGVQLRMQMYAWGQNCLEFVATGTAVRHLTGQGAHRAPDGRAFTSDLSAQDFFRLLAAGAVPVATNSRQFWPQAYICIRSCTPTMPSAARWSASARILAMASSLALYMACVRTWSSVFWFHRPTCSPTW